MVSSERIERDIDQLKQAVAVLAADLYRSDAEYLKALAQAARQQFILLSYQACTQGYPDHFLALTLSQRQTLQQELRSLAKQMQANLLALLPAPETLTQLETPASLTEWQEALEAAIVKEFQTASQAGNRLLHQAKILPSRLPEFLQATSQSESFDPEVALPDLLDLLAETDRDNNATDDDDRDDSKPIAIVQLVAIHLQLADVEFADATTTVLRNRLRSHTVRLKTLRQQYRKKERELAIAQAQNAWRASWYED